VVGLVLGNGLGLIKLNVNDPTAALVAEFALFSILFTDGMRVGIRELTSAWRLPGRALLLGLPLTLLGTALLAHTLLPVTWVAALLLGAVLSPTDPVLASAVVGKEAVPYRLRHLLNVESGLNDGLALPAVLILLAVISSKTFAVGTVLGDLGLGILLGVSVSALVLLLERLPFFSPSVRYEPFNAFALGLLIFSLASLTGANLYLAAFTGGMTVATMSPSVREAFGTFGERVNELLKLAAILLFGALISPDIISNQITISEMTFVILALVIVRPLAFSIALFRSELSKQEWVAAAWFGPKGFASMIYGLLILQSGAPQASYLFVVTAIAITVSIIAHSSTDVLVARWFRDEEKMDRAEKSGGDTSPTSDRHNA
jgi:NhaP-type Na+/H+ or K+/H+ antiporter